MKISGIFIYVFSQKKQTNRRISTSFQMTDPARAAPLMSPMIAPPRKRPTVCVAVQVVCGFSSFRRLSSSLNFLNAPQLSQLTWPWHVHWIVEDRDLF